MRSLNLRQDTDFKVVPHSLQELHLLPWYVFPPLSFPPPFVFLWLDAFDAVHASPDSGPPHPRCLRAQLPTSWMRNKLLWTLWTRGLEHSQKWSNVAAPLRPPLQWCTPWFQAILADSGQLILLVFNQFWNKSKARRRVRRIDTSLGPELFLTNVFGDHIGSWTSTPLIVDVSLSSSFVCSGWKNRKIEKEQCEQSASFWKVMWKILKQFAP